ncbi:hypothetical protein E2C01_066985 [Portunus trituberculatus]|uniref:Uncharacterized protein n=1 Tax=Portunus trituberculatus TaxID=210409 RepID=A0A5B7HRG9_PORTR|nr:hypothetical protein [Portunus trituberculatus]
MFAEVRSPRPARSWEPRSPSKSHNSTGYAASPRLPPVRHGFASSVILSPPSEGEIMQRGLRRREKF